MLENFIYSKTRALFEAQLAAGNVLDEAIVFIEDTKEIWNHGTYFDCSTMDISHLATKAEIPTKTSQLTNDSGYITEIDKNVTYTGTLTDEQVAVFEGTTGQVKSSGFTIAKSVPSDAIFTDTTYNAASSSQNGLMASTDKKRLDFMHSVVSVTTLANIPVTGAIVSATLSAATNISLAAAMEIGQSVTVICTPSASFTQPLPTSGSFISMDGDSLSVTSGKVFEINILCYASGKYSISCKTAA